MMGRRWLQGRRVGWCVSAVTDGVKVAVLLAKGAL